ncbi:MAG: hypothetical protein WBE24_00090, partial [Candidatus Acidiferrum sp.]
MIKAVRILSTAVASVALLAPVSRGQAASEYRLYNDSTAAWPQQPVRAAHGMVATDEQLGSEAGV